MTALEAQRRADEAKAREDAARADRQKRAAEAQAARQRSAEAAQAARERAAEAQAAREREAVAAHPAAAGSIAAGAGPHGQLQPPVIGVVVKGWGEATDGGPATGVSYHAPPGAHVISPCGGRVVFADTFRSYGLLLIVDCGGGYHVVLSGFDRLDVRLGQSIVSGEPVGVMANWEPDRPPTGRPCMSNCGATGSRSIRRRGCGAAVDGTTADMSRAAVALARGLPGPSIRS